jgi:hypothetical protein
MLAHGVRGPEPEEPEEPKWKGLGKFTHYATDHNDVKDPNWKAPEVGYGPSCYPSDWKKAPSNGQMKVTLKRGEHIWFAFENIPDPNRAKYFQLILKGDAIKKLKLVEKKGFKEALNTGTVKVKYIGGNVPEKGKDGILFKRWRYRFGPPQPAWERFKFKARKDISGETITVRAWSICCKTKAERGEWPEMTDFYPPDGAVDIPLDAELCWPISEEAESYDVYFGTDFDDVKYGRRGTFKGNQTARWYDPGTLEPCYNYYWRIEPVIEEEEDEEGKEPPPDGPWPPDGPKVQVDSPITTGDVRIYADMYIGDVWSFTTVSYLVVDDMESYNNLPPDDPNSNRIFEAWIDGLGYTDPPPGHPGNGTGSMVDISTDVIYGGALSMKVNYDNQSHLFPPWPEPRPPKPPPDPNSDPNKPPKPPPDPNRPPPDPNKPTIRTPFYSEAERTFDTPQDWTRCGVTALSLWFYGNPNNDPEPMYVAVEDITGMSAVVVHEDTDATLVETWQGWTICLEEFTDQGVNLTGINKMYIGFGDRYNPQPGGRGTVYFDNITLGTDPCPIADDTPSIVDDFESYSLGTFPSAGGWEMVWAGTGENYVTDAYSYSPTKSLQLWGRPNWACVAQRKFSTDAPVIGYEFAIRIDSIGTGGPGRVEHPAFFSREAYIWGAYYARVIFNHDTGKIEAEDGSILGDWEPGVWYQVKVVLDRSINTYDVWIDHQFKGGGLTTSRTDTDLIDALALISAHPGVKVYYDDVSVF